MAIVSYPAAVHLSKEPSFPFLVMPSLVLAGCSLFPLKPSLLQAEKPSPLSLSSGSKCSNATPSRCAATQLTSVYWWSVSWGRGGNARHCFPDMSKECGGRGIIPSLVVPTGCAPVNTDQEAVGFLCCRDTLVRAQLSVVRAQQGPAAPWGPGGRELSSVPGLVGQGLSGQSPSHTTRVRGAGPVWRWFPASDTAWWWPGRSVVTKAGPRSSWEVSRGVAGPSIRPGSAGL